MSGCASFPGKEIPDYSFRDLAPPPTEKICLVVPETVPEKNRTSMEEAIAVLEKSGYFLKAPERCTPDGESIQYALSLDFRNDVKAANIAVAILTGFISGYTLTIVPGYGRDDFILTAEFRKKDGQLIKKYVYQDHINTWIHLTMLFMMPNHNPRAAINEIYQRMLMNFLYDFSRDVQKGSLAMQTQSQGNNINSSVS